MKVPFTPHIKEARQLLEPLFADGQARPASEVLAAAKAAGLSRFAAHRAKNQLFIRAVKHKDGHWYWEPQPQERKA